MFRIELRTSSCFIMYLPSSSSRQGTVLMALLQPAPETFDLFDDVLLLSEGYVVSYPLLIATQH
jgi:hypothetical protein